MRRSHVTTITVAITSFCLSAIITRGLMKAEAMSGTARKKDDASLLAEIDKVAEECRQETRDMKRKVKECKRELRLAKEARTRGDDGDAEQEERPHDGVANVPYLSIAIPTVPRKKGYLRDTMKSIEKQVAGTWEGNLVVYVMNMKPGEHELFEVLKAEYMHKRWAVFVDCMDKYEDDPSEGIPQVRPFRKQERPTERVRRQSLDVTKLLEHVAGRSRYTLLYEDDFELCDNGLMAIEYMIEKANRYQPGWAGIRCSFGLAGIVLHNKGEYEDVKQFAKYLKRHYARRPPDHLVVEWYAGEIEESKAYFNDRKVMAFRHNIAHHIGEHSSIRETKHWSFPGCFAELIAPQVFPVEAWSPIDCPEDDLWPCTSPHATPSSIAWTTDPKKRVQEGTKIYSK
eukprot:TRINITY_DN17084_c0_g1_i1.p1 TRINITY_DN17084_c0_g1~~TRINITY_DN17084_c0_g1_i1.p1  ORF type:complete len:399 (+),score=137.80 TRINITY_DN17084_c0_g1_i1:381-1577(+)